MATATSDKTAADIAWKLVQTLRRECVGKKKAVSDEEWAAAIEGALSPYIEPDDRYQDGYDDGYDEGYDDAVEEQGRERKKLREKKRAERADKASKRQVIKLTSQIS